MLEVKSLVSGYGRIRVLRRISLGISAGEIVCLIGPNGAGKTTLMRTLAGTLAPWEGEITLEGKPIGGRRADYVVRQGLALVPEGRRIFMPLTVAENLEIGAYVRLRGGHKAEAARTLDEILTLFPRLHERRDQVAGTLSGGEQQMLAIGRALMAKPRLLLLDEPSMGLAPLVVASIFRAIASLRSRGTTVLLAEQNARMALKIADRGYVLITGEIVREGTAKSLLADPTIAATYLGH
ncbi:MAG: ABC transporter ATP-binding protein [Alphaproteobacteria bacterium]